MNKAFSHFTHIPNDDYAFRDLNKVDSQTLEKLSKEGLSLVVLIQLMTVGG